ncbi:unnamed protein product, partial [Brassica oleracea]
GSLFQSFETGRKELERKRPGDITMMIMKYINGFEAF